MNKIIVVGHPASGYEKVYALLCEYGMVPALPSKRDGLSPQAITAALCQAHDVPPLESVTTEGGYTQVGSALFWQGMALDLVLGNLSQPLWGWADSQVIFALEYWNQLDPRLTFVLVYDEPHTVLLESSAFGEDRSAASPSTSCMQKALKNWAAYNGALLSFHGRHPGRCMLVHAQQVQWGRGSCIEQLKPLLLTQAESRAASLGGKADDRPVKDDAIASEGSPMLSRDSGSICVPEANGHASANPLERYLANAVLDQQPSVMTRYAELQAAADLPLDVQVGGGQEAIAAWDSLLRQKRLIWGLLDCLDEALEQEQSVVLELTASAGNLEEAKLLDRSQRLVAKLRAFQERGALLGAGGQLAADERQFLMGQLQRVQEELERRSFRVNDLKRQKAEVLRSLNEARKQSNRHSSQLEEEKRKNSGATEELEALRKELKRYDLRLKSMKQQKAEVIKVRDAARRQVNSLSTQLDKKCSELRAVSGRAPDLSVVSTSAMFSLVVKRCVKKVTPSFFRAYLRARR